MRSLASTLALSLALVVWSETLYYPTETGPWLLALWYLVPLAPAAWVYGRWGGGRLADVVLAGAVFGVLAEGTLVGVVYEAPPFTIVYPSLGWHMAVSAVCGVWGVQAVLRHPRWWPAPVLAIAVGAALGLWWPVWSIDQPVTTASFGVAMVTGFAALIAGHLGLILFGVRRPPGWLVLVALGFCGLGVVEHSFAFPWALPLLLLTLGPLIALMRHAAPTEPSADASATAEPRRLAWFALSPLVAVAMYEAIGRAVSGPVAADLAQTVLGGAQIVAGCALLGWAILRVRGRRALDGESASSVSRP